MNKPLLLLVLCLTACKLSQVNKAGLIASSATIACDYGQTLWHARRGWGEFQEDNVILGTSPSPVNVTNYFITAMLFNGVVYYLLPDYLKPALYVPVTGFQSNAIYGNLEFTPMCGL